MTRSIPRRLFSAGLVLAAFWGAAGWWPMLSAEAPDWSRGTPFPIAAAAAIGWWIALARRARPTQRILMALLSLLIGAGLARDLALTRETRPLDDWPLRVTQWDLADRLAIEDALSAIRPDRPHVVVLFNYRKSDRAADGLRWRMRLHNSVIQDGIILLSRYPVERRTPPAVSGGRALHAAIRAPLGRRIPLLAVHAERPSREDAAGLVAFMDAHRADGPYLLAGSFGLNRTDARLAPLRDRLRPAFEAGGYGWPYSRRAPLPLFSHDNLWVSPGWNVQRAAFRIRTGRGPGSPTLRHTATLSPAQDA